MEEWEKTIMSPEQMQVFDTETNKRMSDLANTTEGNFEQSDMEAIAQSGELAKLSKQAELSYKAGQQDRTKEIIEFWQKLADNNESVKIPFEVKEKCKEWLGEK
jgi:hypothetical protein